MKQILLSDGKPVIMEVPDPLVEPGCILVRSEFSGISSGTELAVMRAVSEPIWRRAVKQPERVRQVLSRMAREGVASTIKGVHDRLAAPVPLGYSAAGIVIAVGTGLDEFHIGDRVAVAGTQCAYHAEILCVPRNLAVHVPANVKFDEAATVALGAIALQGVRRAEPMLGENVAVIGLGVLGQLTCQLLNANGCRVFALDVNPARIALSKELGSAQGYIATSEAVDAIIRSTDGVGVDAVIVTAATASNDVMSQAFRMSRQKGRVVLVGDVGLDLKRNDMYAKELDFRVSCSYGPGRYDERFENMSIDYPIAHVRWTETRNMAEYLRLIDAGSVRLNRLLGKRYIIDQAAAAYAELRDNTVPLAISLFDYRGSNYVPVRTVSTIRRSSSVVLDGRTRLAVIGAGNFFKAAHLPVLRSLANQVSIRAIVSRNGHNAKSLAELCGADYAATDFETVLADERIDAVLIATRHHLHAEMVTHALAAGKHVLVEKPLALNHNELQGLVMQCNANFDGPILQTGYNRRFSPHILRLIELVSKRSGPLIINYRMNAGYIPAGHWVHGPEGGGRNIGEACHIYDLMLALTGGLATRIEAVSTVPKTNYYRADDNFAATMRFSDGSLGCLTYTALGNSKHPKEQMEVFCDGEVYTMDDFLTLSRAGNNVPLLKTKHQDKGLTAQWVAFLNGVRNGCWPVSLETQLEVTRISFEIQNIFQFEQKQNKYI